MCLDKVHPGKSLTLESVQLSSERESLLHGLFCWTAEVFGLLVMFWQKLH